MSRLSQPPQPPSWHGPHPDPHPHPHPGPYGQPEPPRRSHGVRRGDSAAVAFVLSMCRAIRRIPLIPGGITLSARHRRRRGGGPAFAPAAVRSAVLVVVLSLGLLGAADAAGALSKRDSGGRVAGPVFGDVADIEVGDCFDTEEELKTEDVDGKAPPSVDTVPCTGPHQSEAYAVFDLKDGPYPGKEKIIAIADKRCAGKEFTDYVGDDAKLPKTMEIYYYYPTSEGWSSDDHEVTCFLGDTSGSSTGSVRATGS
ncbi:septum formation family protein [Streptomyces sp. NBC_01232]|uniref:septum formation family protein n=1 Tax=Streptomyces sp. NBC_01232 TaxID=2903786 RepID=UPI002E110FEB|nr:septum formation family protein [Streptomyces sp. NBC_01232]